MKLGLLSSSVAALVLAACSSSNDQEPGGAASGKIGAIVLQQTVVTAGGSTYANASASAVFTDAASGGATSSNCTVSKISGCEVTECDLGGTSASDGGSATSPNAGTITLRGGSLPSEGWALEPTGANGAYAPVTSSSVVFVGGDNLTVSAAGGDVPAFADQSVKAPGDIELSAPTFDAQRRTTIDRTTDLTVAWSGSSGGSVTIDLGTTRVNERIVSARCVAEASAGSTEIPAAVLAKLDEADGSSVYGTIVVSPSAKTTFKAGDFDTTFWVMATGTSGTFTTAK